MVATSKKRIAVLRGGPSSEHHFSLLSGKNVIENLDKDKFVPVDVYIDKKGFWHVEGVVVTPYTALQFVDIAFIALHGEYGEDGTVQKLLEDYGIPFIGSDSFASSIGINKHNTKLMLSKSGIVMPRSKVFRPKSKDLDKKVAEVWQAFHHPLIVKPVSSGSSVGMVLCKSYSEALEATKNILTTGHSVLIEEFINGSEVSVSVVEGMRGQELYTPVPIHVRHNSEFFDNITKKTNSYHLSPMEKFSPVEREIVLRTAKHVHKKLGLRHYSQADFIITKNKIYFLEVNTLPGLTESSILPASLKESGISFKDFLTHLVNSVTK